MCFVCKKKKKRNKYDLHFDANRLLSQDKTFIEQSEKQNK